MRSPLAHFLQFFLLFFAFFAFFDFLPFTAGLGLRLLHPLRLFWRRHLRPARPEMISQQKGYHQQTDQYCNAMQPRDRQTDRHQTNKHTVLRPLTFGAFLAVFLALLRFALRRRLGLAIASATASTALACTTQHSSTHKHTALSVCHSNATPPQSTNTHTLFCLLLPSPSLSSPPPAMHPSHSSRQSA